MRTGRHLGVGLAISLLAVAGCQADDSADRAAGGGGVDYVALGDSFSAGPLIPDARNDASGCFVSTNNYPAYLADLLDVSSYTDVTCSGATTEDFSRRQVVPGSRQPEAQLDALSAETDLVTVGIGGNDYGLFGSVLACAGDAKVCGTNLRGGALSTARRIAQPVTRALRAVAKRAPEADVYVVGYLRLMPDKGTCADLGIAAGDIAIANRLQAALNASLEKAAKRSGATYVDVAAASTGHDACAGDEAWVNGKQDVPGEAMAWHPFRTGMEAVARVAYEVITGELAPELTGAAQPAEDAVVRRD